MAADVTSLRRTLQRRAQQAAVIGGATLKTDVRRAAPYKTGETQQKTDVRNFRSTDAGAAFTIISDTPQARWTNDGTRPHTIRPRRAKALRFVVGGRVVFARVVHHPGNKGTRWFERTVAARAPQALRDGWRRSA